MPVYVYQCDSCGVAFERLQSFNEDPLNNCPECNGHVHRVIQPVGIVFKGSGFYVTDNRAKSSTSLPGEKKEVAKESESSSSDADSGDS